MITKRHHSSDSHLPALDGLRGLAVSLVLFHHQVLWFWDSAAWPAVIRLAMRFAWSGVELFFVLSGFLITRLLIRYRAEGRGVGSFFRNRALRILPLYYLCLAAYSIFYLCAPSFGVSPQPVSLPAYFAFLQNWSIARSGQWPGRTLSVMWSLAVEEQFYLVWPWIARWLPRGWVVGVCALAVVGSSVAYHLQVLSGANSAAIYTNTFNHLPSVLCGALIAIFPRFPRYVAHAVFLGALAMLVFSVCPTAGAGLVSWRLPLLGLFYAGLLMETLGEAPLRKLFSLPLLRFLGKYSYGIYLFNPIVAGAVLFLTGREGGWLPVLLGTIAAAWISWHAFEKRFLAYKV